MTAQRLVPPIFVWETGDLTCFATVADAQISLEAIDVKDGAYIAFDAEGRRLRLSTQVERTGGFLFPNSPIERVVIDCAEDTPSGQGALSDILRSFLQSVGEDSTRLRSLSLAELEERARLRAAR